MTTTKSENQNRPDSQSETTGEDHAERQRPSYDDVNVPVVILVGIVSMVLTFVTIWFVEGIYYQWKDGVVTTQNYEVENTIQKTTINQQKSQLEGVTEEGIVPFDSVIEIVVSEYDNSQPTTADINQTDKDSHKQEEEH